MAKQHDERGSRSRAEAGRSEWIEDSVPSAREGMTEEEKRAHDLFGRSGPRDGAISGASGLNGTDASGQDRSESHRANEPGESDGGANRGGAGTGGDA